MGRAAARKHQAPFDPAYTLGRVIIAAQCSHRCLQRRPYLDKVSGDIICFTMLEEFPDAK
jgi:hypothetical protein